MRDTVLNFPNQDAMSFRERKGQHLGSWRVDRLVGRLPNAGFELQYDFCVVIHLRLLSPA
jgi:hypothetical protein